MHLTTKQLELMRVISAGSTDGSNVDLGQILARLSYKTTKASLQFSIRALIGKDLIEKSGKIVRRNRERQTIGVTLYGSGFYPRPTLSGILTTPEDDLEID